MKAFILPTNITNLFLKAFYFHRVPSLLIIYHHQSKFLLLLENQIVISSFHLCQSYKEVNHVIPTYIQKRFIRLTSKT